MNNTGFQMFIATFLLVTPSSLNQLLADPTNTSAEFSKDMLSSKFSADAITRANSDLFPNLETQIPGPLLTSLRSQTTLRGVFAALGVIIHTQLVGLYGGGTIHPTGDEAASLVSAAKLLDGVS